MSSLIRTTEKPKSRLEFDDLRFPVGEPVRIEVRTPDFRVAATYAGKHFSTALIFSLSGKSQKLKTLPAGTPVTVRFIAANKACAFSSRALKSPNTGLPLLFLEYPRAIDVVEVRKAVRVKSKIIVSLDAPGSAQLGSWPRQALCTDISLHGARLEASDQLGELDQPLMLTARMPVGEVDQMLMTTAAIRNVEDYEDPQTGDYRVVHGVEFTDFSEETQLVLSGFVYQQMLVELGVI